MNKTINSKQKNTSLIFLTILIAALCFKMPLDFIEANDKKSTSYQKIQKRNYIIPSPVDFLENEEKGLQIKTWVNGAGPFTFIIDTGAGFTFISHKVAAQANVMSYGQRVEIQGVGQTHPVLADEVKLKELAIGGRDNPLPNQGRVAVIDTLPPGVDGILDPTEAFQPLGYILDFPNSSIDVFNPNIESLHSRQAPQDGAIVRWGLDPQGRRPFVKINNKADALIDTGARFGLAMSYSTARALNINTSNQIDNGVLYDLNGYKTSVYRVKPATVQLESMVLDKIPTDIIDKASSTTPVLIGRDALRPFRISFDPRSRLIEFSPINN